MKTKRIFQLSILLTAALLTTSCANDIAQDGQQDIDKFPAGTTTFYSENNLNTRTTLADYTKGNSAHVLWEATDHIWVKDDNGTFRQSSITKFPEPSNKNEAIFGLTGNFTGANHMVVYTGKNSASPTEVEIKAVQTPTATNNFDHLGEWGDCGVAIAKKNPNGGYRFFLEHKAAYLCLYPRLEYERLNRNVRLNKIIVKSTSGPIAGKYDFTNGTLGTTPTSSASNTITITTPSGKMSLSTRNDSCYYVVIAPGSHTLSVDYYIEDPTTHVSGVITKELGTVACDAGKMGDFTAWIEKDIPNLGNNYYMWDAKQKYWAGFEWDSSNPLQPTANNANNTNYPKDNNDPRWYDQASDISGHDPFTYSHINPLFNTLPNANEMIWYVANGDPHWDANQIWIAFGHLYKGGMWFKKLVKIATDEGVTLEHMKVSLVGANTDGAGIQNTISNTPSTTPLTISEKQNYFFLPAMGYYDAGTLQDFGISGRYYASTHWAMPHMAHGLEFNSSSAMAEYYFSKEYGCMAVPFK